MPIEDFQTSTTRPGNGRPKIPRNVFARYRPQIVVGLLVVAVLAGGAYYSSRASEAVPKVVYSTSLQEAEVEAQTPLLVDVNTADIEKLDELPEVGPSTAEAIIEYRDSNGSFKDLDELEEVPGIGPATLEKIKPFATV